MNNGNYYPPQQGGYPPQQNGQQPQEGFWPNVTGFRCGPSKSGKSQAVSFTINAFSNSKNAPMTFQDFMNALQQAFQESGGQGVRIVLPFRQGQGPRGPFQSATIGIFPNQRQSQSFGGGGGGGRRSYPPQQAQGYGQPQQQGYPQQGYQGGYQGPTQGMAPTQPSIPPQQGYPQGMQQPPAASPPPTTQAAAPPQQPPQGGWTEDNIPF